MTYLPHLDYNLQRLGPDLGHPRVQADLREIDDLCGMLIEAAQRKGNRVIVVSEYGIAPATDAVHINRALREAGLIAVRPEEYGREILDAGASVAFAMSDHQIAHVYVADPARIGDVKRLIEDLDGVESVLDEAGKRAKGLDNPRSGELVAIANPDRWFSYYYWLDPEKAPDFARTVDIHRKPGYDPVELFVDPELSHPKLSMGWKLAKRKLGFRQLLDVVSPSATHLVKGTHGRFTARPNDGPLVISSEPHLLPEGAVEATDFKELTLAHVFGADDSPLQEDCQ